MAAVGSRDAYADEAPPAKAGLLWIVADEAPASPVRARWTESFTRNGYVVQTAVLSRSTSYAQLYTSLAKMRVALRDDALLVVIADAPVRLSGLPESETSLEWSALPPSPNRRDVGMKLEGMDSLVSWAAPSRGRLFIFSLQSPSLPAARIESASRAAFETPAFGPKRWMVWPSEPGGRTESSSRGVSLFESCLADTDLPAQLERGFDSDDWLSALGKRVRALSGDRQKPVVWKSTGSDSAREGDALRKLIAELAGKECDGERWLRQAEAAEILGDHRTALGLATAAALLPGDALMPVRAGLLKGKVRLAMGDSQSLRFELAGLTDAFQRPGMDGLLRYEYSILRGEAEETQAHARDAAAAYGEAWSIRLALSQPPPVLDIRLHTGLGRLASAAGRNEEARQRFEQAAECAAQLPESERIWNARLAIYRAEWHARMGEWEAARTWGECAIEQSGSFPSLHDPLIQLVGAIAERMAIEGKTELANALIEKGRHDLVRPKEEEPAIWRRVDVRNEVAAGRLKEAAQMIGRISPDERAKDASWAELEAQLLAAEGQFLPAAMKYKIALGLLQSRGADTDQVLDLKIRLADCFLRGSRAEQALSVCDEVLGDDHADDLRRVEALRMSIQSAQLMGSSDRVIHHAQAYLKINPVPASTPEEARWLLDAAAYALHEYQKSVALGLVQSALYAAREAQYADLNFWAKARETHARALPPLDPSAWPEAVESLRILELNHLQISEDAARVGLLISEIAREQGDWARSAAYLSRVRELMAIPQLTRDSELAQRVQEAWIQLNRGVGMPPPADDSAIPVRYETGPETNR